MTTKDNKALNELRRLTECCICLMPFTDPRMLPCIHSACLKCFEDIQTKTQKKPGDVIPCPVCRKEFTIPPTGMSGVQKNFFVENLLEITENLNEEAASPRCPNHPLQVLNYYCGDCKIVVCVSCFVEKHASHRCKDVATVDKDFRKSLEASSSKMLLYIAQMEAKRSKMESKKTNFLEQTSQIKNTIRLKNQQLKEMIDQHAQLVLNELSSMKQKHLKNIETEIEEIERQMAILQSFETYCSEIKSKGSPTDVCSCVNGLIRRADELKKENDEYLSRPDYVVEVKFKTTDQDVLIRSSGNVIGQIEVKSKASIGGKSCVGPPVVVPVCASDLYLESTELGKSCPIVVGGSDDGSPEIVKRYAIVIGGYDAKSAFGDVAIINLHRPDDVLPSQKMPIPMQNEAASAVHCNSIYITGLGKNTDEIWRFDAITNIWKKCASLLKGRRRHSVAFVDQFLYICGGYVNFTGSVLDDVEAYDAKNNRCSSAGKLVHCVFNSSNCVPFNSCLYIFGGSNHRNKAMSHVQVYNTKSNTCTLLSQSMPIACNYMRAALFGKTFVLLGIDNTFLYDLETETWQERRQFKTEVHHFGMIIENGQLFVIGGGKDALDGKSTWTYSDDVRCIPVKNILENKAIKWRQHAKLSRRSLVFTCEKINFEA